MRPSSFAVFLFLLLLPMATLSFLHRSVRVRSSSSSSSLLRPWLDVVSSSDTSSLSSSFAHVARSRVSPPTIGASSSSSPSHRRFASSSSSSDFVAPAPPESDGAAVFDDVDVTSPPTEDAARRNSDPDAVFVVTGASRGIGLHLCRALLGRTRGRVVACCRDPSSFPRTNDDDDGRIDVVELDLENPDHVDDFSLPPTSSSFGRVDAVFHVAGVLGNGVDDPGPERSLARVERAWLEKSLAVHVVGPTLLTKRLAPSLRVNVKKNDRPRSVVVHLSARVGSISDNRLGGWYSYRVSKAALNQAVRTTAHELARKGTLVAAVHPGTTDTDLSRPFSANMAEQGRLFPVEFTVDRILDLVDRLDETRSGGLYDWAGKSIPF